MQSSKIVVYESPMGLHESASKSNEERELRLRFDYTNLERLSPLAKHIEAIQNDCSIRRQANFTFPHGAGLGSQLHVYGMNLCVVLEMKNARFRAVGEFWYNDIEKCPSFPNAPMQCYFPQAEPHCPISANETTLETFLVSYNKDTREGCPNITALTGGYSNVRAATTEYLFTRLSDVVQNEGERQLNLLFKDLRRVPKNLITVHVRWGDKSAEMDLVPIKKYTEAVQHIIDNRRARRKEQQSRDDEEKEVHIFFATEDPKAYEEFMKAKPQHWNVYVDPYYHQAIGRNYMRTSNGLIALGSLLVAIEANDFVLTTASNWSRMMNELRKNVIDPRCNNCTTLIDLLYDEL